MVVGKRLRRSSLIGKRKGRRVSIRDVKEGENFEKEKEG